MARAHRCSGPVQGHRPAEAVAGSGIGSGEPGLDAERVGSGIASLRYEEGNDKAKSQQAREANDPCGRVMRVSNPQARIGGTALQRPAVTAPIPW